MESLKLVPLIFFAGGALGCWLTRVGTLGALLVASFCGIIIISFTGGASGAVWLAQAFLLTTSITVLWRGRVHATLPKPTYWLIALFAVYGLGIVTGMVRFDSSLMITKGMNVDRVMGIPLRLAMAGYRTLILGSLVLAFVIPLKYTIDPATFRRLGILCWWLALIFSISGLLTYLGIVNLSYDYRSAAGYVNVAVLGFHRAAAALMIVTGAFFSYAAAVKHTSGLSKALYYAGYIVMALGLLATWSRSGLVCLVVALVTMVLLEGIVRGPGPMFLMILIALAGIAGLYLIPGMEQRFNLHRAISDSMASRYENWRDLGQWLVAHPMGLLFGAGFQNFYYEITIGEQATTLEAAHNMYLQALAECGIAGFVLLLCWLGSTLRWLWRWHQEDRSYGVDSPASPLLGLWIGLIVSGLTQESIVPSPSMIPYQLCFFLLFGCWVSYYSYQAQTRSAMQTSVSFS